MTETTIQARYDALQNEKSKLNLSNQDDAWRAKLIEQEQSQLQEQMSRTQQQAADLEDIQLPQDYNAVFEDPRANDEIKNLLRQVKEQLYNQHNSEMMEVHQSYQDKLKASEGALNQLNQSYGDMKASYDRLANELNAVTTEKQKLEDELKDALSKRDNAAAQLEEAIAEKVKALKDVESLKNQVNELEAQLAPYKKPAKKGGFHLTSTIKDETPEERQARLKREELERINARLAERGVDPLPLPDLPVKAATDQDIQQQTEAVQQAAEEAARFPEVVSSDGAGPEAQEGAGAAVVDADAQEEPLTLEQRVSALEAWRLEVQHEMKMMGIAV